MPSLAFLPSNVTLLFFLLRVPEYFTTSMLRALVYPTVLQGSKSSKVCLHSPLTIPLCSSSTLQAIRLNRSVLCDLRGKRLPAKYPASCHCPAFPSRLCGGFHPGATDSRSKCSSGVGEWVEQSGAAVPAHTTGSLEDKTMYIFQFRFSFVKGSLWFLLSLVLV